MQLWRDDVELEITGTRGILFIFLYFQPYSSSQWSSMTQEVRFVKTTSSMPTIISGHRK